MDSNEHNHNTNNCPVEKNLINQAPTVIQNNSPGNVNKCLPSFLLENTEHDNYFDQSIDDDESNESKDNIEMNTNLYPVKDNMKFNYNAFDKNTTQDTLLNHSHNNINENPVINNNPFRFNSQNYYFNNSNNLITNQIPYMNNSFNNYISNQN